MSVTERTFGREPSRGGSGGPVTYELATWGTRALAYVLDLLVVGLFGVALAIGVLVAEGDTDDSRRLAEQLAFYAGIPLSALYAPLLMMRRGERNGQTLGKQAMGIRVVREQGGELSLGNGLMREVVGRQLLVPFTYGLYAVIDYLWPLWDASRQCLHDKVAQTRVVRATAVGTDAGEDAAPGLGPHGLPAAPPPPPRSAADEAPVRDGWLPPAPGA